MEERAGFEPADGGKKIPLSGIIMEERAGFEPADGGTVTGFQDRLFQPLRHLSI